MVAVIKALAVPPEPPVLIPGYDDANLIFRLQTAAQAAADARVSADVLEREITAQAAKAITQFMAAG